ncbi:MAG: hypothetical protein QJR08_04230 [Bacillota bacterium]|nr:hypothetical protein [Bacillota bacterium]
MILSSAWEARPEQVEVRPASALKQHITIRRRWCGDYAVRGAAESVRRQRWLYARSMETHLREEHGMIGPLEGLARADVLRLLEDLSLAMGWAREARTA